MNFFKKGILVLALAMFLSACSTGTVANINGDKVSEQEYEEAYRMHRNLYAAQFGEEFLKNPGQSGQTMEQELRGQVMDLMVLYSLMEQDLKDNGIEISSAEIDGANNETKQEMGGEEGYEEFKNTTKFSDEDFERYNYQNLLYQKHLDYYTNNVADITDEKVKEEYEANKDKYDTVEAAHILVATEDEAKAVKERLDAGEDFAAVAQEVSTDEGSKVNGGALGQFNASTMVPQFSEAAFAMEEGQISDPVQSEFGWHIIYLTAKHTGLESAQEQIRQQLSAQGYQTYLDGLKADADIVTNIPEMPDSATESITEATEAPSTDTDATTEAPAQTEAAPETEATE